MSKLPIPRTMRNNDLTDEDVGYNYQDQLKHEDDLFGSRKGTKRKLLIDDCLDCGHGFLYHKVGKFGTRVKCQLCGCNVDYKDFCDKHFGDDDN